MVELSAIKVLKEDHKEQIIGLVLPAEGKMLVEDLCGLINVKSMGTVKAIIKAKNIEYHKVGYKWIIDLADFWAKTTQTHP